MADESQRKALERAFSGRLGGPLAELAELKTKPDAVEPAAIRFATDGSSTEVDVGQTVSRGRSC